MSFIVVFVNIFFLSEPLKIAADNVHSRHVAQICLYCRHKNVCIKRHYLICGCVQFFFGIDRCGILGTLNPAFFSFFPPLSSAPPCRSNCSLICFSWPNSLRWQPAIWIHDMLHKSVHIVGTRMCICECVPIFMGLMDVWSLELWTRALFPFFSITVISTTMSFKVSVNVLLLAGNLHSRHVAHTSLCCRHKNVCTKRHLLTCECVWFFLELCCQPIFQKNVYPTFESWTLNPKPWTLTLVSFFLRTLLFPPLSSALCLSKCLLMYFCWPKPLESQRAKCIVDIMLHKSVCIVSTGMCE